MSVDLAEMRAKWERYGHRLSEGDNDGSLVGASFIIAKSGVTDVLELVDHFQELERCARGLVRTAAVTVGAREVVPQWWDALVRVLEPVEGVL